MVDHTTLQIGKLLYEIETVSLLLPTSRRGARRLLVCCPRVDGKSVLKLRATLLAVFDRAILQRGVGIALDWFYCDIEREGESDNVRILTRRKRALFSRRRRERTESPETDKILAKKAAIPNAFKHIPVYARMGQVMCIDYSVGGRYLERHHQIREGSCGYYLAALRTHHKTEKFSLLFDDGTEIPNI